MRRNNRFDKEKGRRKRQETFRRFFFRIFEKGAEMSEVAGSKYRNLSKKYRIDRDDFEAQFERLTRYVLETYNFGSELVVLAYLDLIRNGDVPEAIEQKKDAGIYRREKGEEIKAKNVIRRPSEIEEEARKKKQEEEARKKKQAEKKAEAEKKEDPPKGSGIENQIAGQINIFDEAPAENVKSESDASNAKEK